MSAERRQRRSTTPWKSWRRRSSGDGDSCGPPGGASAGIRVASSASEAPPSRLRANSRRSGSRSRHAARTGRRELYGIARSDSRHRAKNQRRPALPARRISSSRRRLLPRPRLASTRRRRLCPSSVSDRSSSAISASRATSRGHGKRLRISASGGSRASAARLIRFFPARLARYRAWSAASTSSEAEGASSGYAATPRLTVTETPAGALSMTKGSRLTRSRSCSATPMPPAPSTASRKTKNSSPANRMA